MHPGMLFRNRFPLSFPEKDSFPHGPFHAFSALLLLRSRIPSTRAPPRSPPESLRLSARLRKNGGHGAGLQGMQGMHAGPLFRVCARSPFRVSPLTALFSTLCIPLFLCGAHAAPLPVRPRSFLEPPDLRFSGEKESKPLLRIRCIAAYASPASPFLLGPL